jgi:hypothetical protein
LYLPSPFSLPKVVFNTSSNPTVAFLNSGPFLAQKQESELKKRAPGNRLSKELGEADGGGQDTQLLSIVFRNSPSVKFGWAMSRCNRLDCLPCCSRSSLSVTSRPRSPVASSSLRRKRSRLTASFVKRDVEPVTYPVSFNAMLHRQCKFTFHTYSCSLCMFLEELPEYRIEMLSS